MERKFILSCESTVDVPYEYMRKRNIPVIFYSYAIDGEEYTDDMGRDPKALSRFYSLLADGKMPSTSQLNEYKYEDYLDGLLQKGDVLHIAFGSGMTPSVKNAMKAAETLKEKYPGRKLVIIDSLCSSSGYGLLVDGAADIADKGCTLEETAQWVYENRHTIHHQFFSTDLKYYRRSGRVSGPAAMIGTILSICPIMRLDDKGKIIAYGKVRGKAAAIKTTVDAMEKHAVNGRDYSGKCWICHSNCIDDAKQTESAIIERFPKIKGNTRIFDIGTIIASHTGPGTVAVFFYGDEREPYNK